MENRQKNKAGTSDYASAYKMKSGTIDKRVIRAQRRSLDWKKLRHNEVNKRRNLENLSPLQESSDHISTTNKSFKGKTPVKHTSRGAVVTPKRGARPGTPKMDLRKEKLKKWRQERDTKRKLEAMERTKHQPFRVCHIEHTDMQFLKKDTSKQSKKSTVAAEQVEKRVTRSSVQPNQPKPATKSAMRALPVSKPLDKAQKKNTQLQDKFKKPALVSGHVTRSSNVKTASKQPIVTRNLRPRHNPASEPQAVKNKVSKPPIALQNVETVDEEDVSVIDISKVSTYRGDSFAPSDFTFAAPCSVSSFVFKPLSPASAANFLFPSQDSSSSFLSSAPNRCSTPISSKSRQNSLPVVDSNSPNQQENELPANQTVFRDSAAGDGTLIENKSVDGKDIPTDENVAIDNADTSQFITDNKHDTVETSLCANDNTVVSVSDISTARKNSIKKSVSIKVDDAENSTVCEDVFKEVESSTDANTLEDGKENDLQQKTPVHETRSSRRTMSAMDRFVHPTNQTLPLSEKRSGRKRRRSENSHSYSAKSPEEWVKLLKQSPMVEMTRRTPKHRTPPEDVRPPPVLNFDDIDMDDSLSIINNANLAPVIEDLAPVIEDLAPVIEDLTAVTTLDPCTVHLIPAPVEAEMDHMQSEDSTANETQEKKSTDPSDTAVQLDNDGEHGVQYFRLLMATETSRLSQLSDHWNKINSSSQLSEDVEGQIRTTTGQAQLLMVQRFKQFHSLVDNCEFKRGEKETTCTDLQGFWDMIFFQVEDVNGKFQDLEKLQANNWLIPEEKLPVKKPVVKKTVKKTSKPPVKSKFAAFRAQIKKQDESEEKAADSEDKVFDAGFFTVSSPVHKNLKPHCEGGTPKKSLSDAEPADVKCKEPSPSVPVTSVLTEEPATAHFTPFRTPRRSYVPVVPSPLLNDITPQPKHRRCSSMRKTPIPKRLSEVINATDEESKENISSNKPGSENAVEGKKTTRRSLRLRKSVCFNELVETLEKSSAEVSDDDSFSRFLQPSQASSPTPAESSVHGSVLGSSPFGDNSLDDGHRSCLKQLPSVDRRRSRRSVQFSPLKDADTRKMPSTPFNKDSLVAQSRVKKRKSSLQKLNDQPSVNMELEQLLADTDAAKSPGRKSRPSLLYTPPRQQSSPQIQTDVPTDTLISFSP